MLNLKWNQSQTSTFVRFSFSATNTSTSQLSARAIRQGTKIFLALASGKVRADRCDAKYPARFDRPFPEIPGARCSRLFDPRFFLCLSDDFSAKTASELCGPRRPPENQLQPIESGHDASVSLLTGKTISHRANITASKSYNTQTDFRFDMKTFTELRNAQAIVLAYDGLNRSADLLLFETVLQRP